MKTIQQHIQKLTDKYYDTILQVRQHLHTYPELSFQEYKTADFIEHTLKKHNILFQRVAKTGVVAFVGSISANAKTIALRGDIDALPIQEKNNCSYASKNNGIMHACGHDVHTACVLGTAIILKQIETELKGGVKFIFQPGEEVLPGGASIMIKEKVLQMPKVNAVLAQHVFPDLEAGKFGFRPSAYMASTDEIHINIIGKGGHAALPQQANNPIPIMAEIIQQFNKDYPLEKMLKEQIILSVGKIEAQGATNVIPEKLYMAGTMRTLNQEKREKLYTYITQTIQKICKKYKAQYQLKIIKGYPPLVNDKKLTTFFIKSAEELVGKKNIIGLPIRMTADDFSYYLQKVPGTYFRLGTGNKKKKITANVHTPYFDIDESALWHGTNMLSWLSYKYISL